MKQQQQGDVLIERIQSIPKSAKRINHLILAEGETTGHKHEVICDEGTATLFEEKGEMYLSVKGGKVTLTHEEHKNQTLAPGNYKIGIVQEYDYDTEEARNVRD